MKTPSKVAQNKALPGKVSKDMGTPKNIEKLTIFVSWPAKPLWINRRAGHSHWQSIDAKTAALSEGCAATLQALNGQPKPDWHCSRLAITIEAHKQNRAPFDLDNLTGALKSHLDGIAATLGINDNQIDSLMVIRGKPDKAPFVSIEIRPL